MRRICLQSVVVLWWMLAWCVAATADDFDDVRQALLDEIAADVKFSRDYLGKAALDERVLAALRKVPRHEFVPADQRRFAYDNRPLPIGHGQTISQPYIVAVMTDMLDLKPGAKVLEIGTGSGYQAAVLAELSAQVYSIEIISALEKSARERLQRLKYHPVSVRLGDGYYGWEEQAPFDAIIVTAAASHIPPPLIQQLKPGGIMVIPVGSSFLVQQLVQVRKDAAGKITTRQMLPVRFVPLTGSH